MFGDKRLEDFDFESIYHIYSHVSGKELIFRESKNYTFFLDKIKFYICPIADIFAYCLMPNHFHLLIAFKKKEIIFENLNISITEFDDKKSHQFLMKPFSNLLNSYAKAYNKVYTRKGAFSAPSKPPPLFPQTFSSAFLFFADAKSKNGAWKIEDKRG